MNPNAKTIAVSATLTLAAAVTGLAVLMAGFNAPADQDFRTPVTQSETVQNAPADQAAVQGAAVESAPQDTSTEVGTPAQAPAKTTTAKVASVPSEGQSAPAADEQVAAPRPTPKPAPVKVTDPKDHSAPEAEETTAGRGVAAQDTTEVAIPEGGKTAPVKTCNVADKADPCNN